MHWFGITYLVIVSLATFFELIISGYEGFIFLPTDLREETDMNWFGCIFVYILLVLVSPVVFIGKMVYLLCDWLFHI